MDGNSKRDISLSYWSFLTRARRCISEAIVVPLIFKEIPSLVADANWRARYTGLLAIAALAKCTDQTSSIMPSAPGKDLACVDVLKNHLEEITELVKFAAYHLWLLNDLCVIRFVVRGFNDPNPLVRWAACQWT